MLKLINFIVKLVGDQIHEINVFLLEVVLEQVIFTLQKYKILYESQNEILQFKRVD